MKMGVKEFRERFSEVAEGSEPILVTKNGRIVGKYDPSARSKPDKRDWDALEAKLGTIRSNWKARTPDWRERMAGIGLDENGEDLAT
jgi:antitoxin (DNA-binding transcriptional repressor) of toxin-antitoxin stability system